MRLFLFLFILSFIPDSHAGQCNKTFFDKPMNQQFIESLNRYFSVHKKTLEQTTLKDIIDNFSNEGKKER